MVLNDHFNSSMILKAFEEFVSLLFALYHAARIVTMEFPCF